MFTRRIGFAILSAVGFISAISPSGVNAEISAEGKATLPTTSSNYFDLEPCSPKLKTFCVESFVLDLNNDGAFESPSDSLGISMHAWLFNLQYDMPGVGWEILVNGSQDLSPVVPAGTKAQVRINTGLFEPTANLLSQADIEAFSVEFSNDRWLTSVDFATSEFTFALDCTSDAECAVTKSQIDHDSYAQGTMFWDDPSPKTQAQHNMWVATNASTIYELQFDRETLTWSVILVAPLKKKDGSPNLIRYTTFIPDSAISYSYGTTPDLLTKYLSVTRTDYDVTREVKATITRVLSPVPGVVLSIPDIRVFGKVVEKSSQTRSGSTSFSTRPKLLIKPKVAILPAPKYVSASLVGKSVQLIGRPVAGATRYQAMCSRGATVILGQSTTTPRATAAGLTPGRWRCQLRAKGKLGGNWSAPITVTVRK